jgi:hypothetical protein
MKNHENGIEFRPEETLVIQTKGSLKKKWYKFIEGTMYLTNQSLYFNPHKPHIGGELIEIPLKEIHVVREEKALGLISNRLIISDSDANEYNFTVSKRKTFLQALEQQMQQI